MSTNTTGSESPQYHPDESSQNQGKTSATGSGFFKGCLIAVLVIGVLGFLGAVAFVGLIVAAAMAGGPGTGGNAQIREVTIGGKRGAAKVVCIPVEGMIFGSSSASNELTPVRFVSEQLRRAKRDSRVRGAVIFVDSPGGGITASDILLREIKEFRKGDDGKPVVVCMRDMAASGGYYISCGADKIIAHPTTVTGSIGVLMPMYDATELLGKVGVKNETITSGDFKDIGSPFTEKTQEQKEKERELLQTIVIQLHTRFVEVVAEGRNMKPEEVRKLADGRIFTGPQAAENRLVDEVGYESDAIEAIKKMEGLKNVHLVQYKRVITLTDVVAAFGEGPDLDIEFGGRLPPLKGMRPMYLWSPPALEDGEKGLPR
ncbi:MAG: signal peptide peptidase SppA [Candidatus Brocadiia bacterium]